MVITKKQIKEMKQLRNKKYSYNKISLTLGINLQTVVYHLNEHYREWRKELSRGKYTKEKRKYFRDYKRERYKNDPEFREKIKKNLRDAYKKKKESENERSKNKRK